VSRAESRSVASLTTAWATGVIVGIGASVTLWRRSQRAARGPEPPRAPETLDEQLGTPAPDGSRADAVERRTSNALLVRVDEVQRRRPVFGLPFAVAKKFGEDSAGNLASLIAHYGFLSLFPLLLALTTVLGIVLADHPDLQRRVLDSALAQFPVIGDQIEQNIHSLNGSIFALVVGVGGALWGGMGVMKTAGNAMDEIWEVPKRDRPTFVRAALRAALMLVVLGAGVVITALLSGFGTAGSTSFFPLRAIGLAVAAVVNVGLFVLGFRVLTVRDIAVRDLLPGAVVAGIGWLLLQSFGGYYITHQLRGTSQTYGMFAVVLGLLAWIYLQAQLTLFAAEVNVVRVAKLWPRSLTGDLTDADKRALASYAEVEERRPEMDVGVGFATDRDEH
jgi:YihY family inner membrane protein